jgi:hypothetical protein
LPPNIGGWGSRLAPNGSRGSRGSSGSRGSNSSSGSSGSRGSRGSRGSNGSSGSSGSKQKSLPVVPSFWKEGLGVVERNNDITYYELNI